MTTENMLRHMDQKERDIFCLNIAKKNMPQFFKDMTLKEWGHVRDKNSEKDTEHRCCRCNEIKPLSEFKIIKRRGVLVPFSSCQICQAMYQKQYNNKIKSSCRTDVV